MIDVSRRVLMGVAAAYIASQVLPATRLVYWPSDVWIEAADVTVDRSFPGDMLGLPRPRVSYIESVTPLSRAAHNGGRFCQDVGGPKTYGSEAQYGQWSIEGWASECLSDPLGYRWDAEWTWHLGGLTFGSASLSKTVIHN